MDILPTLRRNKWWLLLAILLLLNLIRYWPLRHASSSAAGHGPSADAMQFPQPDAAMQARIDALPEDQKLAVEDRMKADRVFFASVQSLPPAERQQKMQEHFAQNPPPMGPPPGGPPPGSGGPGDGGPGDPGNGPFDGGAPHIPPPDVRRGMDLGLVNAMKNGAAQ